MPFTLSHPLYAVPLRKLIPALSATGLALGSMMPDMEYFIAMQPVRTNGHTLAGFILNGIPLCTALAYAFHRIVMPALPYLLPSAGGLNRFAADCRSDWSLKSLRSFISFYVSLFIGFLSHLFVDGWTHRTGFYVNMFPSLREPVVAGFPGYWLLQQSLSVIGLLLPLLYLFVLWRSWSKGENASASRRQVQPGSFMPYLLAGALVAAFVFLAKLARANDPFMLNIWFVAPFTSLLFGLYAAALLRIGKLRFKTFPALCGLASFALLYGLLQIAKRIHFLDGIALWHLYIFALSGLLYAVSVLVAGGTRSQVIALNNMHPK